MNPGRQKDGEAQFNISNSASWDSAASDSCATKRT